MTTGAAGRRYRWWRWWLAGVDARGFAAAVAAAPLCDEPDDDDARDRPRAYPLDVDGGDPEVR